MTRSRNTARGPTKKPAKKTAKPARAKPSAKRGKAGKPVSGSTHSPEAMRRALDALAAMRNGKSLSRAARAAHTSVATVKKYTGVALARQEDGRYAVRSDRLIRHIRLLTPEGIASVPVRGPAAASRIARYWTAVDHYLRTGDVTRLLAFRGKGTRIGKVLHPFITDPATLQRLAYAGEVSFEDLYAMTA